MTLPGRQRPPSNLGCSYIIMLAIFGLIAAVVVASLFADWYSNQSCPPDDCWEGSIGDAYYPVMLGFVLWPVLSTALVFLASRLRKREIARWDANSADPS